VRRTSHEPNGLAFSPDERTLYVADSGASHDLEGSHHILAFDVAGDGALRNRRVFAVIDAGIPDGFRVDGSKRNRLFIAAGSSLYAVYVGTRGAQQP
jgi:gluconolactonase